MLSFGIAAIFILLSMSTTVRLEILRRFHSEGIDLFTVIKRPGAGVTAPGQIRILTPEIEEWLKDNNHLLVDVAAERRLNLPVAFHNLSFPASIVGTTAGYLPVNELKMKSGRFLSPEDTGQPFCVIGYQIYQKLRQVTKTNLAGQTLHIGPLAFQIIGILRPSKGFRSEYSIDESVIIPFATLVQYTQIPEVTKISIKTDPKYPIVELNDFIKSKLELFLGDASHYEVNNQQVFVEKIRNHVSDITLYLGFLGCIAFFLGVWGQFAFMARTVKTRKKLFSLMRIFGVRKRRIFWQVFMEAVLQGLIAWILGVAIGVICFQWLTQYFNWFPVISLNTYFITLAIALVFSSVVGLFSALQTGETRLNMMLQIE